MQLRIIRCSMYTKRGFIYQSILKYSLDFRGTVVQADFESFTVRIETYLPNRL